MRADKFFEEYNKEHEIDPTSMIIPEHKKAVTTMQEVLRLEGYSNSFDEDVTKKEQKKRVYNKTLGKTIPAWMNDYIEDAVGEASDNKELHFISYGQGDFGCGGYVNTLHLDGAKYITLTTRTGSGDKLSDTALLINIFFGCVGCKAEAIYTGSNKYHGTALCLHREHACIGGDYKIGKMSAEKEWKDWADREDAIYVLKGKNVRSKLTSLIYEYLCECAKCKLSAGVPFRISRFKSKYELHRQSVNSKKQQDIDRINWNIEQQERRIADYRELLQYDLTEISIGDCDYIPFSVGGQFRYSLSYGDKKHKELLINKFSQMRLKY